MADPVTILLSFVGGAVAGLLGSYFTFYARSWRRVRVVSRDQSGNLRVRSMKPEDLERSRREMRTLMLERDLLSSALTRIYEAETEGKITREEREGIARRYSDQMRELEGKLRDKELLVEVGELERLRDDLVSLFSEKIENIEARLQQAKEKLSPTRPEMKIEVSRRQTPAVTVTEELEKVVERRVQTKDESEGEKKARELRDEVMDALAKLEQIDVKKENEDA